jgi:hypothetical protein
MTTYHHTHTSLETQEAIRILGLFFPTHQTAQILLPENYASLEPSQDAVLRKRFGSGGDVLEV